MASGAVHDAVMARLAGFTAAPVHGPNTLREPPADGGPYVLVMYPAGSETQASIGSPGSNRFREEGAIRFVVHVPRDEGIARAHALGDALRGLFRNYRSGALQCFEATPVTTNEDLDDEAYFIVSTSVAYEFDILA